MSTRAILPVVTAIVLPVALLFTVPPAGGCGGNGHDPGGGGRAAAGAPAGAKRGGEEPRANTFTGTLRGGIAAGGGETTGWVLEGDGAVGGLDVDVSKVRKAAEKLDGKRVTVKGRMTERDWPERGPTPVLVADSIEAAPDKADDTGGRTTPATGHEGRG